MTLLVFALLVVVERRNLLIAAAYSIGADAVRLLAVRQGAEGAARTRPALVLTVETILDSLMLGFSVALRPDVLWFAFLGCLVGTLVGMLPGIGPLAGI